MTFHFQSFSSPPVQPGAVVSMLSSLRLLHKDRVGYKTENRRLLLVCNYTYGNRATGRAELGPMRSLANNVKKRKRKKLKWIV